MKKMDHTQSHQSLTVCSLKHLIHCFNLNLCYQHVLDSGFSLGQTFFHFCIFIDLILDVPRI